MGNGQKESERLVVGNCSGDRRAFTGEYSFEDLKAAGDIFAQVQLVEGTTVLASSQTSPRAVQTENCLFLEPAWDDSVNDDGAVGPIGGNGGVGSSDPLDGGDGDAGGAGGSTPPPECEASVAPRPCVGVAGNCAKGMQACVNNKWGDCSVVKAPKDSCDAPGDDADCDGAPNKGCMCLPAVLRPGLDRTGFNRLSDELEEDFLIAQHAADKT